MNYAISHLIGDFLLQNDWISDNKKKSSMVCFFHVMLYLIPFILLTNFNLTQLLFIGVQHFLQDRWNFVTWFMKLKGSEDFLKPPCAPWSIIVTDNIIHLSFIYFIIILFGVS